MIDNIDVKLVPIDPTDRNQFVLDNQEAFKYGATEEFGMRDDHFEEDGEIISRDTITESVIKTQISLQMHPMKCSDLKK